MINICNILSPTFISLWVVLCNLVEMISISKNHAWWFCCELWGVFGLTKSTIAGWKKKKKKRKTWSWNVDVGFSSKQTVTWCDMWGMTWVFLVALEWNYLLKKKKKRFQGSFFKRGLHTFSRFWQKNKQNILVERVYVLITISFASWLSFGRWEMGCGLPRSWDFNN